MLPSRYIEISKVKLKTTAFNVQIEVLFTQNELKVSNEADFIYPKISLVLQSK